MAFFGRFTERAQRALIYAQEEARGSALISTP